MSNAVVLTIDFATLYRVIGCVIEDAKPILIRGKHGIGKSEVVYNIASRLVWNETDKTVKFCSCSMQNSLPVIERRASQMTEGDLVGLPVINNNRTSFNPPDWFKEACEHPVVLFLDEVDRAIIEVRQGIFELVDSRKLNGFKLHPGTRIFAAINGGKYSKQYQVGEMDPAELDRWTTFDVEPSVEDWIIWAKSDNIHPTIVHFINDNKNHLDHLEGDYEPNKKYPSRRSWKRLSDVLKRTNFLESYNKDSIPLSAAFVGVEAAIALNDFIKNMKQILSPKDIIDGGKYKLTEKFSVNEHLSLIERMEQTSEISVVLQQQQLENLARYFVSLPSELSMKLFGVIGRSVNYQKFYELKIDGLSIKKFSIDVLSSQAKNKQTQTKDE